MPSENGGIKKKRGMKRLKGFITGKSRRERRKSKLQQNGDNKVDGPDDASTLYGADMDASVAGSVTSASVATASKQSAFADPVQVILLVMDPATRRFELLQLEFDSALSKVSDIFKQIPEAATEEVLQKATYRAVITPKGEELKSDVFISDYAKGATVVIAVPENAEESLQKCAAMAVPILTNSKVHKMLLSVGIKEEDLPEKPKKKKIEMIPEKVAEEAKQEEAKQEEPIKEEPKGEVVENTTSLVEEPLQTIIKTPAAKENDDSDDDTNYFVVGVLFAIFAHLFIKAHMSISTPLSPGSTLSLGKYRNSCGLLGSVPFYPCEPKSMTMGKDGLLQVFERDELVFSLEGKLCGEGEEGCVDGVVVAEDGTLKIGGEKAKAKMKATRALSPWPFSEDVVYKTGGILNLI